MDHTDTFNCETSTNKRSLDKDNQSCKRTMKQSMSDEIQKLTRQIEQFENLAKCQNATKNTKMKYVSYDDELIYQQPNKIIKYDNEIICADSCNSDENSNGSTNRINTTKHVNKKIKLDKNIIFQNDEDSERDSKNLTNGEVEMFWELSYKIDDKIIYDDEDNTCIKISDVCTNEDNDSINIPNQEDSNTSIKQVLEESILDTDKIGFSTDDQSMIQSNDCSESSINQSDEFMNIGETLVLEMYNHDVDNGSDSKSIDHDEFLDLTKCENDEIILDHENCTSVTNEDIYSSKDFGRIIEQERKLNQSTKKVDDHDSVYENLNNEEKNDIEPAITVDDLHDVKIVDTVHPKIVSKSVNDFENILEPVNETCMNSESVTINSNTNPLYEIQKVSKKYEYNNNVDTSGKRISDKKLIESRRDNEKIPSDYDKKTLSQIIIEKNAHKINDLINIPNQEDTNTSIKRVFGESILDTDKIGFSTDDQSMVQSNDCSESSINLSTEFMYVGDFIFVPEMYDENVDNSSDSKSIDHDEFLDLTKCENDEIILDNENCTSVTNEDINCTSMIQSNDCSESSINQSDEFMNIGETLVPEMCNHDVDNGSDSKSIDHDEFLDLTKCENDEIILGNENCTSVTNEDINCTSMIQSNDCSESSINQSDEFMNIGETLVSEMCNHDVDNGCDSKSIDHDEFLDLTKCENDEIILGNENCTSVTNEDINCTRDFGRMIEQEGKLNELTKHVDNHDSVYENLNNEKINDIEPANTVDDLHDVKIVDTVHPKIDCENNLNHRDLLDIRKVVNEEIMLENENGTSKINPGPKNVILKTLTTEEVEMLTKLFNNEDDELGIVTDCTDKITVSQTCEDYINENISKKLKNVDDLLEVTTDASDENARMISEGKSSDQADKLTTSINHESEITVFNNKEIDILTEGNSQSLVTGDQFMSNTFYFGTENCRDVSIHTIHSLDDYEMNNCSRNNTTVHSMENNNILVSLNNETENSIVELYCNSENKILSRDKNKSEYYEDGEIMKQTIKNITVSLDSSNSFHQSLINISKSVNDFENILEPVNETCMNSESVTINSNTNPLYEIQKVSKKYEYNNNIDTSDKRISDKKLIESRRDNEKIPSDYDKKPLSQIIIEKNAHKINNLINIPNQEDTNTSIKRVFEESILDTDKIGFSTDDQSMIQSNDCSESSINLSTEFMYVGDFIFVPEMYDENVDNSSDSKSIDHDEFLDLTKCENDEIILGNENCTSVTNEDINCTSMIQSNDCSESSINQSDEFMNIGETLVPEMCNHDVDNGSDSKSIDHDEFLDLTKCENDEIILGNENCTSVTNEDLNCTRDFGRMIEQEGKLNELTKHVDNHDSVYENLNNEKINDIEPANTVDDLHDVKIVDTVHPKIDACGKSISDEELNESRSDHEMITSDHEKTTISKIILPNDCSESSLNQSDEFMNIGETLVPEMCNHDVDNSSDSKSIDHDEFLDLTKCENDEIILGNENCTSVTNEDINCTSMIQSNDCSESSINQSDEFMNIGETLVPEMCNHDVDNGSDSKSIDHDEFLDLTKCENDEIILGNENCTSVTNEDLNCTRDFGRMIEQEGKLNELTKHVDNHDSVYENLNNEKINDIEPANTVDDLHDVKIVDTVHPKIDACGKSISDEELNESRSDHEMITSDHEKTTISKIILPNDCSESSLNQSDEFMNIGETLVPEMCNHDVDNSSDSKSIDHDEFLDLTKCENDEIILGNENCTSVTNEDINCTSMIQSNDCSESSINQSDEFMNIGETLVPEMCNHDVDNGSDSKSIDHDEFLDLTKCENDDIILDHENCTSVTNEDIYCTKDFGRMIEQEGKLNELTKHVDNHDSVYENLNNEKINDIEPANTVDVLHDVKIVDTVHPKIDACGKSISDEELNESRSDHEMITSDHEKTTISKIILPNDCSESSLNQSDKFMNIGETLVPEMCNHDVDNSSDSKRIDHDEFWDLTKCENDEIILGHENCTSVTNEDINCTRSFDNVNSEIQMDSEQKSQYSGDCIHEKDFGRIIEQERKLNQSTKKVDDHDSVCENLNNKEKNDIEPANTVDDLHDVNIVDGVHPKIDCENNLNHRDLLDIRKVVNEEIMLENENGTSKINPGPKNVILKTLTTEEVEMLTKLFNNEDDELGIVTDCTDKITVSQTCEDYINENISKKLKNVDDLLEVTTDASDENARMISEGKSSDQADKLTTSINHESEITVFNNKEIDILTEGSLSFNASDAERILESSNDGSEHFDDSLLFKPSDRDLIRYGIECEAYKKSISQSLNNLENNISNKEVIPQCKSRCLRLNKVSKSINNHVSSSYVKDYEDNVIDFYDCELSSIENSDVEDNFLLSFEKDTSRDDCIFVKNQDKLKNATNSTSNEQTCDNNLKIQNLSSPSENCNNLTNAVESHQIHSPIHNHQYFKIISTSISKDQMQMNSDADDKLKSVNHSKNKINSCNTISSFKNSDNNNNIQSNNLSIDQGELNSNCNEDQNLEDSIKSHHLSNKNKSDSGYNTHRNKKKSRKLYGDNESESSIKMTGNCTISKSNNEAIPKTNTVQFSNSDIDQSEIEKKKYLDEIIKNEQLFNEFDEKLDVNESAISPFISQSLAKSTNLKSALAKKAAAYINVNDMGNKALSTYLTQQKMTLDVLKVLHKSLDTCPSSGILMEDPEGLVVPLMPHQKHAIAWLIWRESQEPHGGILADDMGLGKTLSMISLVLKLKEKPQDSLLPVVSIRENDVIIGGTLVVCPASLINQWETEVKTKLKPGLLKVGQYYGIKRNFSAVKLAKNDLVFTSYHVVMWDHKIRRNTSPLYKIMWDRIILDEGHNIRNHKTQTSVAVCNIKSLNRWAITGTPIHNREADFFTLLKFVRCKPFDDWAVWKMWVGNNDDAGKHRLSLLVKTLMLRRTKTELTQFTTFNLPKKEINTIEIELSKEERNAYEKLLQFSSNLFATYLYDRAAKEKVFDPSIKVQSKVQYFQEQSQDKDKVFKDHPELLKLFRQFKNIEELQTYHILVLLLRLRQICCHPTLIKGPITEDSIKKEDNMESIPEDDTDVINTDSYNENTVIDTFPDDIDLSDLMNCLTLEDEPIKKKPVIDCNIFQQSWISTKIKKICDLVNQKVLIDGQGEKAIIVSQWPSFLYLIRKHLAHYNAKMEMYSGAIPIAKRNKIICDFNNPNGGPQILLLSLKAGGVGLNLMAANHMFLVDVHWNPQLEAQACDRVYRVGQTKPVYIYKFLCSNTIETRISNIQTHKLQIAKNLFKGTSVVSSHITMDDLKQIFS